MTSFKQIHFYFGLAIIIHFAITGALMRLNYFSIEPEHTLIRMMLRANHGYILFIGLIHLFIHFSIKQNSSSPTLLNYLASTILILSSIGINISFYIDPINHMDMQANLIQRKFTGYSVQGFLVGSVVQLLLLQFQKKYITN